MTDDIEAMKAELEKFRATKERAREYKRKWQRENPEKVMESARKWKRENPEKVREYKRKTRAKKRAAKIAATKQYYIDHPEQDRRKVAR